MIIQYKSFDVIVLFKEGHFLFQIYSLHLQIDQRFTHYFIFLTHSKSCFFFKNPG